ncbi:MAG: hypothetical protein P4L82_19240 [Ancalomicrobiaceae bacterium]|nr:hypothetical protein [Ancalomicrobiaceae bacterium]
MARRTAGELLQSEPTARPMPAAASMVLAGGLVLIRIVALAIDG